MKIRTTPYIVHVFVCVNDRQGTRKSCADGGGAEIRMALKQAIRRRNWDGRVRISQSGCLGVCDAGPNVMIYPQKIWFSQVKTEDADTIIDKIEEILNA